jgi:hypothetical protein
MKNNKKVYMQLRSLQRQIGEQMEVYYEHLVKLANCLQVKVVDMFLTTIFKSSL